MPPKVSPETAEKIIKVNVLLLPDKTADQVENILVEVLKNNGITRVVYDQYLKDKKEASAKKKKNTKASNDEGPAGGMLHENVAPASVMEGLPQPVLDAVGTDNNVARVLEQLMERPEEEDEEVEKQVGKQVADPVATSAVMVMRTCETLGQKLEVALQNQGITSVDRERYLQAKNDLVKQSLVLKEEQKTCPAKVEARKKAGKDFKVLSKECRRLGDVAWNAGVAVETLKRDEKSLVSNKVSQDTIKNVQNDIKVWENVLNAANNELAKFNSQKAIAKKVLEDARKDEDVTKCKVRTSQAVISMGKLVLSQVVPEKGSQKFRAESIAQAVIQQLNHHILKLTTPSPALYDILADIFEYLWNVDKSGDDGCARDLMLGNGNEDGEDGEVIDIPRPVKPAVKPAMDLEAKYTLEEFFNQFQVFVESRNQKTVEEDCKALETRFNVKVDPKTIGHTLLTQVKRAIECIKSMGKAVIARKVTPFNTASKATDAEAEVEAEAEAEAEAGASGSGASGAKNPSVMEENLNSTSEALSKSIQALKKASNQALVKESKVVDLTLSDSDKEEGASSSSKKPQSAPKVKASQAFQGSHTVFSDNDIEDNDITRKRKAKKAKKAEKAKKAKKAEEAEEAEEAEKAKKAKKAEEAEEAEEAEKAGKTKKRVSVFDSDSD